MLCNDLDVIDSMWVGYMLTEPDFHALQRIKAALVESQKPMHNSDYTKCADAILSLDCADAVINKRGVLVAILKQHFA
jgi:hypothetical protein